MWNSKLLPGGLVGCAFMNKADRDSHRQVSRVLKEETEGNPFRSYMGDWNPAMRAAVRSEFPAARIYGCLFHFAQALVRKASSVEVGLAVEIRTPGDIYKHFLGFSTLPLLPAADIPELLEMLAQEALLVSSRVFACIYSSQSNS